MTILVQYITNKTLLKKMHPVAEMILKALLSLVFSLYYTILCLVKQIVPYKYRSKSIKGEICLVTGAGSGIGKLMAKKFAKLGARMVIIDVNERDNEKTANEISAEGGEVKAFTCDLSKREEIYKVAEQVGYFVF